MPRIARKNISEKFFHVLVQGIGKDYVFPDDNCKGYYLSCLKKAKKSYPAVILGFCIMGNHAHILVEVADTNELSSFFRIANSTYASYYNRVNNRVGYVFRDRFKSQAITSERQLAYCLAYIQNNPLKANITNNPEEYEYSSYKNYVTKTGIVDICEAGKYFDTSIENIYAIMQERTDTTWLDHEEVAEGQENFENVLCELKKRYNIKDGEIIDIQIATLVTKEMQQRCGASVKRMAKELGITREKLRKKVVATPVP